MKMELRYKYNTTNRCDKCDNLEAKLQPISLVSFSLFDTNLSIISPMHIVSQKNRFVNKNEQNIAKKLNILYTTYM